MPKKLMDAQAAYSFLVQQLSYIEAEVYRTKYPDFNFAEIVPVDSAAPEWIKSVTFFSIDHVGQARWMAGPAFDVPYADYQRSQFEKQIWMAAIGYEYNLEEISTAAYLGLSVGTEKAFAARFAYQQFMYNVAITGDTEKGLTGLVNDASVTAGNFPADGTGSSILWADKTPEQIVRDVNSLLQGIYTGSKQVEMANTLLLPVDLFLAISARLMTAGSTETVMEFIRKNNVYTIVTGQQLLIRALRGLEDAGAGSTGRVVAYLRDPTVVKLHLPMPHRFLPVWQDGPMNFSVPGIFRTGGVEVRRPAAMRYGDGAIA